MSKHRFTTALLAAALSLPACTTLKPGRAACVFGGATEAEDLICAQVNFGVEGVLYSANQSTAGDCKDHVIAAARRLDGRYATEGLISCPDFIEDCHASALVHTPEGDFVLDNGALRYPGNVMTLAEFRDWIGPEPFRVVSIEHIKYLAANPAGALFAGKP